MAKAPALSNPELSPHRDFVDLGGHGYGVVTVDATRMLTDFICIPHPIKRTGPCAAVCGTRCRCVAPASVPKCIGLY